MQIETIKSIGKTTRLQRLGRSIRRNWILYAFLLPTFVYLAVFHYWPLYGVQIAFKKFVPSKGIWGSNWVGFSHFEKFFSSYMFGDLLKNTVVLSVYQLLAAFPFPIVLALLLNYCISRRLRRATQMVTYAPHFISTVVLVGMMMVFMSQSGIFNQLLGKLGLAPVPFLSDATLFRHIYVWSHIWQRTGYNSVIYIAALASVSPELHEAAIMDGANKLQRIWHVDLPAIRPTVVTMLIFACGNMINIGFDKVFLMQNSMNLAKSEVIATFVYKVGLVNADYGFSTAAGLFQSLVSFIMLVTVNQISKKITETSLW